MAFDKVIAAFKLNDSEIRKSAQSGGAFNAIASHYLSMPNTVCYGVAMEADLSVDYRRITSMEEYPLIQKSKYVQARIGDAFQDILKDLRGHKQVIFSGTPCQVDGLKRFLDGQRYTGNLITIDLICHGVPSPKVYEEYIQYLHKKTESKVEEFEFRATDLGWGPHVEKYRTSDGKIRYSEEYKQMFYSHLPLRPACYTCRYASLKRVADFTIGDYWGVNRHHPDFYDKDGVSLILFNTGTALRSKDAILNVGKYLLLEQREIFQPNLQVPTYVSKQARKRFWRRFLKEGWNADYRDVFRLQEWAAKIHDLIYRFQRAYAKYVLKNSIWR